MSRRPRSSDPTIDEVSTPARAPEGRRTSQAARQPRGRVAPPRNETARHGRDETRPTELRSRPVAPVRSNGERRHAPRQVTARGPRLVVVDPALVRAQVDRKRISMMVVAVIALLAVLGGRLVYVQISQGSHWRDQASRQSTDRKVIPASRGSIVARDGMPVAGDVPGDRVVVDPKQVDNPQYYAHALTSVLGIDEQVLLEMLQPQKTAAGKALRYRVVSDSVDANTAEVIKEMDFPGITVEPQPRRDYPAGALAATVLGTVKPGDTGSEGSAGVEFMYDSVLRGRPGVLVADHDVNGLEIPRSEQRNTPARRGQDVVLTLDSGIQYQAEQILLDQVIAQNARGGNVTVTDLANGDVLAMANVTDGRTHRGAHISTAKQSNQSVVMGYEPGSVMKIVAISSAIDRGCITPTTRFLVPRSMRNGQFTLTDDENHETQWWTAREIITHSSNVGTAMIAKQCFDAAELDSLFKRFGFGQPTGLGFPGEAKGMLVQPQHYGDSGVASNSIGYGTLVSPLQVLDAYAAVARGGVPVTPRLARETIDAAGRHRAEPVVLGDRVVRSSTATAMRSMFANVVREGTGVCAAVPNFEVAGKTGTVRKRGSYGEHYASFVGYAPANAPRIAVMVVLDNPAETYGGKAAAPVFSEVMTVALARMRVAPTAVKPGVIPQFDEAHDHARREGKNCSVPHGSQLSAIVAARNAPPAPTTTTSTATTKPSTAATKNTKAGSGSTSSTATSASTSSRSTTAATTVASKTSRPQSRTP